MKKRIVIIVAMFLMIPQVAMAYNIMTGGLWGNFTELERPVYSHNTHLVHISGCSFREWNLATYDIWKALANWNDPKSGDAVFGGDFITCEESKRSESISQIYLTRDLDPGTTGLTRRHTNFFSNTATYFKVWLDVNLRQGEFLSCSSGDAAGENRIAVASHEFGHGLGFNHAQSNRWGVMRTFIPRKGYYCDNLRDESLTTLHVDDIAALVDWYHDPNYTPYRDISPISYWLNPPSPADDSGDIRATRPTAKTLFLCPGDRIYQTEFSIANRGNRRMTYKRTWWSTPDISLHGHKSLVLKQVKRVKSPGSRNGVFQSRQNLYFGHRDIPPEGESWDIVLETSVDGNEDRLDNNNVVLNFKIKRGQNCH